MGFCLKLLPRSAPYSNCNISDVEFKMPDCNKCERIMTNTISKFKGVASCVTDTENQKIVVTGNFNLDKLLKKLMKVTNGKEVEIVTKESEKVAESEVVEIIQAEKKEEAEMVQEKEKVLETVLEEDEKAEEEDEAKPETIVEPNSDERKEMEKFMMFSDENPNAKCNIS